jgi:hypothetical protein
MTESQMMKYFGWTDPKMPALYIAEARGEEIAEAGADNQVLVSFEQQVHQLAVA